MKKNILLGVFIILGYGAQSHAMQGDGGHSIEFNIPPLKVDWPQHSIPFEFTVSPSTLVSIAGAIGLYQTVNLVADGIKKVSDSSEEKKAEGKRILTYSSLLFCGSMIAILSKLAFR